MPRPNQGVGAAPELSEHGSVATVYVKLVLTAVFWGGTFIAGRHVSQHLDAFVIAFLRFAMASVVLLALMGVQEGRLPHPGRRQIIPILLLGMTGIFAYNALFFKGLYLIEASRAALVIATCPAFIAAASVVFLKERLWLARAIGIPLSVFGAAVVISRGDLRQIAASGIGVGELYILGCVLSWTAYSLIGRVAMRQLSPLATVTYSAVVGTLALAVPSAFRDFAGNLGRASLLDWLCIAYLAVFGTVLGFVWFYQGVRLIGPTRAGLFINVVPISAVVLAFFILREPVTWSLAAGAVLVLLGAYLTNRTPRPQSRAVQRRQG